jgi:hypothetical protein
MKIKIMTQVFTQIKLALLKTLRGYLVIYPIYVQPFLSPLVAASIIISFLSGGTYEQRIKLLDKDIYLNAFIKQQNQINALANLAKVDQAVPKEQIHSYYIPEIFKIYVTPSEVVK